MKKGSNIVCYYLFSGWLVDLPLLQAPNLPLDQSQCLQQIASK
jgi:hypothetical protein